MLTVLVILAIVAVQAQAIYTYRPCPEFVGSVDIHNVTITPDPVIKGNPMHVYVNATIHKDIHEDAYVKGTAKFLFLNMPIAKTLVKEYIDVPVKEGPYEMDKDIETKGGMPPGTYEIHLEGYNDPDDRLFCIDASVDIKHQPSIV